LTALTGNQPCPAAGAASQPGRPGRRRSDWRNSGLAGHPSLGASGGRGGRRAATRIRVCGLERCGWKGRRPKDTVGGYLAVTIAAAHSSRLPPGGRRTLAKFHRSFSRRVAMTLYFMPSPPRCRSKSPRLGRAPTVAGLDRAGQREASAADPNGKDPRRLLDPSNSEFGCSGISDRRCARSCPSSVRTTYRHCY